MNFDLTPPERAFRAEVRAFLETNLTDEMRRGQKLTTGVYPEPEISRPWHRKLAERGWAAPLWPTEYGGPGWTGVQRFIFEAECALASAPLVYPMGVRLVAPVIIKFGTEEQKRHYLARILSGEDYWCQGYSEPGAGSDLAALQARAVVDDDDYVINGTKIWTTHAHHANRMFMLVRTSTEGKPQQGISFLLVDLRSPGIVIRPIRSISGEHEVNQVFFDAVRVPRSNLVGRQNGGWDCAKYLLEFERGAGLFSGRLRSSLNRVRDVLAALQSQGAPGLDRAEAMRRFTEVAMRLDVFEMLELLNLRQHGRRAGEASPSILKLKASRLKQEVGRLGMDLIGLNALEWSGTIPENDDAVALKRIAALDYLGGRAFTIFGGTQEIQLGIIARTVLQK
jgi:acyl-CoA dehydrogenase